MSDQDNQDRQLIFVINGLMIKIIAGTLVVGVGFIGWLGQSTVALREDMAKSMSQHVAETEYNNFRFRAIELSAAQHKRDDDDRDEQIRAIQLSLAAMGQTIRVNSKGRETLQGELNGLENKRVSSPIPESKGTNSH